MASYLYCVLRPARAEALPRALRGIAGREVRSLTSAALDPLEAWVATVSEDELERTGDRLAGQALLHNEIVNTALSTGRTPVPARFGVYFPDDDNCVRSLVDRRAQLLSALDRVANAVEISVLVVPREAASGKSRRPSSSESGAGRRYLEELRKQAEAAARQRLAVGAEADRISDAVGNIVRAEHRSVDDRGIVTLAHLVSRTALDDYRECVAAVRADEGMRILVGDVRAPYSFAYADPRGTGHDSSSLIHNE